MEDEAVRTLAVCLAVLFAAASFHKLKAVVRGTADREPLAVAWGLGKAHARWTFMLAGAIEVLLAAGLLLQPGPALLTSAAVLAGYGCLLKRLDEEEGCNCFGKTFAEASRTTAIVRNLVLASLALAAGAAQLFADTAVAPLNEWTIGVSLILLATLAATGVRDRLLLQGRGSLKYGQETM